MKLFFFVIAFSSLRSFISLAKAFCLASSDLRLPLLGNAFSPSLGNTACNTHIKGV